MNFDEFMKPEIVFHSILQEHVCSLHNLSLSNKTLIDLQICI